MEIMLNLRRMDYTAWHPYAVESTAADVSLAGQDKRTSNLNISRPPAEPNLPWLDHQSPCPPVWYKV